MSLTNIGDELGKLIRIRQCLELFDNGGASPALDSLTQLIDEVEPVFDTDTTARRMLPSVVGFLNKCRNTVRVLLAECDQVAMAVMRNRMAADINSTALSNDIFGLIGDFDNYLRDNTKEVLQSTPAAGAVTAGSTNTGSGIPVINILDTFNLNNQSIQNADYWVTCTTDAITGSANQHQEVFALSSSFGFGLTGIKSCMYPAADGSGDAGGGNRLQNEDGTTPTGNDNDDTTIPFENFTTNTPDGWTIDTGAATTNVLEEAVAGNYLFGSKGLEFLGDVGGTLTEISQDANDFFGATSTDQKLDPLAHYLVCYYMKSADTTGKVSAYLDGTAYTAGATEKATYDFNASGALASFTLVTGVAKMPKAIPTDMKYVIKVETALGNGVSAYIDGACLAKMYHIEGLGINIAIPAGGTAFVADERDPDRWSFSTTNDWAGLFQEFFARRTDPRDLTRMKYGDFGMHVNADGGASAEIAETKAQ